MKCKGRKQSDSLRLSLRLCGSAALRLCGSAALFLGLVANTTAHSHSRRALGYVGLSLCCWSFGLCAAWHPTSMASIMPISSITHRPVRARLGPRLLNSISTIEFAKVLLIGHPQTSGSEFIRQFIELFSYQGMRFRRYFRLFGVWITRYRIMLQPGCRGLPGFISTF